MNNSNQTVYNGTVFTVINTIPPLSDEERALLRRSIADDLKAALARLN